jgi:hypothetical protein
MGDVIIDGLTGANRLVVLDANGKIPAVDGSAVTALAGANFSTGTIPVARIDTGTTAGKVVKLDGNAKLPAVSGAALTGVAGATKNASDPVITTNPSGGVGTEWQNTSTGEVYVCTDATAGANVWKNVGDQSGDVAPYHGYGSSYGFLIGGNPCNDCERFPFASDSASVDLNTTLTSGRLHASGGNFSTTHGYACGGSGSSNIMDRYAFVSTANCVDWGDLSQGRSAVASASSKTYGYSMGGEAPGYGQTTIDKFSLSASGNATDVGDLTKGAYNYPAGHQSSTYGYTSSATRMDPHADSNIIDKFPFATDTNASDVGDLTAAYWGGAGISSATYGYTTGGNPSRNVISRFSFTTDGNSTDWADLSAGNDSSSGTQSTTHGYSLAGNNDSTRMDKFPFASQTNATDIANLAVGGKGKSSAQY